MRAAPALLLLSALPLGCSDGGGQGEGRYLEWDTGLGATSGGTSGGTTIACTWRDGAMHFEIVNGNPAGYTLGLARPVGAEMDVAPWTGEDCYLGYTTAHGVQYHLCHDAGVAGVTLRTVYTRAEVVPSRTTLHRSGGPTAHFLQESFSGLCWTWGDTSGHYAPLGCMDLSSVMACWER